MRILIAEDDTTSRLILEVAIVGLGHTCFLVEDGLEALALFQRDEVDVIISDWIIPGINGLELCRLVRANHSKSYTYFIFLTELGDKEHLLAGINAGADDYLAKPLDPDELQICLLVAARINKLHRRMADQAAELESLNRQLFEQGRVDSLTKLGNRLRLQEDLEILYGRVERYGQSYTALMCDIDYFKSYNDTFGHLAGDEVLRQVASTLSLTCRAGDCIYRYGGEEFLIILAEQSLLSAQIVAERFCKAVENLGISHENSRALNVVTMSIGIALLSPKEDNDIEQWLKQADSALYRAKEAGRNRVVVHEAS